jgi:hypothetical protein
MRATEIPENRPSEGDNKDEDYKKKCLKQASFNGLVGIYVCKLSMGRKKGISFIRLAEVSGANIEYLTGYLTCLSVFDLLEYEDEKQVLICTDMESYIQNNIEAFLESRIERSNYKEKWSAVKTAVEDYFASNEEPTQST